MRERYFEHQPDTLTIENVSDNEQRFEFFGFHDVLTKDALQAFAKTNT